MTNSFFDTRQRLSPETYARKVLLELGIDSFPIDAKSIVEKRGIVCAESDFKGINFDGALRRQNGKALIVINSSILYPGRKNFTIAHELGHFEIKGHDEPEYRCSFKNIHVFKSEKEYEYEANRFAAELLMPEEKIQEIMKRNPFNLETVKLISENFATSITSAALRAAKLTRDSCAMVVSANNQVLWSQKSANFRYTLKSKGQTLSLDTYAADFFLGKDVPDQPEMVSPYGWVSDCGLPNDLVLLEHSVYFPNINMVLSLITLPGKDDYYLDIDEFDNE